ncbi:MAG: DUF5723 family protein [Bacteroidales bacterium]|nr:DUF5723 family protein [Bacteroidales bacterium]
MKKIILTIFTTAVVLIIQAQVPRTSYFMDKYANRHQLNPALTPAWGYINFPGLGNIYIGTESNLRLSNFVYPPDTGRLQTFMHRDVKADDFLKRVKKSNHIGGHFNLNVLGFGFYVNNDKFFSFDMNVKTEVGMNIPKDVFTMFKRGMTDSAGTAYNIKNMNVVARAYTEFALGYAQDVNESLRVGGKLKFLIGHADARLKVDRMDVLMSPDIWTIHPTATGTILGNFLVPEYDSAGNIRIDKVATPEKLGTSNFFGGYGAAIDLGAVYNFDKILGNLQGFTVSFGLTDLGFITYSKDKVIQAQAQHEVIYEGFDLQFENSELKIDFDKLTGQFTNMLELREIPATGDVTRALRTTTNLGLEYSFLQNKMSAGLLWSTHFGLPSTFSELTLSYNLRPVNWFSLSLSSSVAHGFFRSAGWAMNITPKYGLNLFIGMDYVPFAWTPKLDKLDYGVPFGLPIYTANVNVNFGLSIPLGRNRHHNYPRSRGSRDRDKNTDTDINIEDLPLLDEE